MLWYLLLLLPGLAIGLAIVFGRGSYTEFEKAQRKRKLPPNTALTRQLQAQGRRIQIIDLDTNEVYEPQVKKENKL